MLVLNIPLHWVLLGHFNKTVYNWGHTMLCQTEQFCIYQLSETFFAYTSCHQFPCLYQFSHKLLCLYQSLFVYRIHQRPRGGERLAGRYNAEERLRRLLRPGRCAGRVRSVGTSREGRSSSRCRVAGSGKEAASTVM